jgi:hypothetical protein
MRQGLVFIVTLITDFGLKDGNVGVMKGVILRYAPAAQIVDLSHLIAPQDIREAALILVRSAPYFPPGTVHVVVVDPGVGTSRRPVAVRLGEQYFVGPDNGVITLFLEHAERAGWQVQAVWLDQPQFWLAEVSDVFHGRDIFAPVAAQLAAGVLLENLGTPINDLQRLDLPRPEPTPTGWRGQVIHLDHFGNISTNLHREHLLPGRQVTVRLAGVQIAGLVRTFGERPAGELIALFGSTGSLFVAEVNGNAARRLAVRLGDPVEVDCSPPSPISP